MSPERPPEGLRGRHWSLTVGSGIVLNNQVLDMPRGISVQSLKSLVVLEVSQLLGVSRASSKESKRTSLVLEWSQTFRNVLDIHRGISVQILKY